MRNLGRAIALCSTLAGPAFAEGDLPTELSSPCEKYTQASEEHSLQDRMSGVISPQLIRARTKCALFLKKVKGAINETSQTGHEELRNYSSGQEEKHYTLAALAADQSRQMAAHLINVAQGAIRRNNSDGGNPHTFRDVKLPSLAGILGEVYRLNADVKCDTGAFDAGLTTLESCTVALDGYKQMLDTEEIYEDEYGESVRDEYATHYDKFRARVDDMME